MTRASWRGEANPTECLRGEIAGVSPWDEAERADHGETLAWLATRQQSLVPQGAHPVLPVKVTFVCMDGHHVLLVEPKAGGRWRPPRGDVRALEHPRDCVRRLLRDDLAVSSAPAVHGPVLLCSDGVLGGSRGLHLWYVLMLRRDTELRVDLSVLHDVHWFIANELPERTEPNVRRFLAKLASDSHVFATGALGQVSSRREGRPSTTAALTPLPMTDLSS